MLKEEKWSHNAMCSIFVGCPDSCDFSLLNYLIVKYFFKLNISKFINFYDL